MNDSNSASSPAKVWRLIDQNPFPVGHSKRRRWDELCWLLEERESGIMARALANHPEENASPESEREWIVQVQVEIFDTRAEVLMGLVSTYDDAKFHEDLMAMWVGIVLGGTEWPAATQWKFAREEVRWKLQQRSFQWKADCLARARAATEKAGSTPVIGTATPPQEQSETANVPKPQPSPIDTDNLMTNMSWSDLENKFRELGQRVGALRVRWRAAGWHGTSPYGTWRFDLQHRQFAGQVEWLAKAAMTRLTPDTVPTLERWLDLIREEGQNFERQGVRGMQHDNGVSDESEAGMVWDVCSASADQCVKYQAEEWSSPGRLSPPVLIPIAVVQEKKGNQPSSNQSRPDQSITVPPSANVSPTDATKESAPGTVLEDCRVNDYGSWADMERRFRELQKVRKLTGFWSVDDGWSFHYRSDGLEGRLGIVAKLAMAKLNKPIKSQPLHDWLELLRPTTPHYIADDASVPSRSGRIDDVSLASAEFTIEIQAAALRNESLPHSLPDPQTVDSPQLANGKSERAYTRAADLKEERNRLVLERGQSFGDGIEAIGKRIGIDASAIRAMIRGEPPGSRYSLSTKSKLFDRLKISQREWDDE